MYNFSFLSDIYSFSHIQTLLLQCNINCNLISLTSILVNLVKGIFWDGQHSHIGTKFFYERFYHCLTGRIRGNSDAFGSDLLAAILEVESHYTMKLQILLEKKIKYKWNKPGEQ